MRCISLSLTKATGDTPLYWPAELDGEHHPVRGPRPERGAVPDPDGRQHRLPRQEQVGGVVLAWVFPCEGTEHSRLCWCLCSTQRKTGTQLYYPFLFISFLRPPRDKTYLPAAAASLDSVSDTNTEVFTVKRGIVGSSDIDLSEQLDKQDNKQSCLGVWTKLFCQRFSKQSRLQVVPAWTRNLPWSQPRPPVGAQPQVILSK